MHCTLLTLGDKLSKGDCPSSETEKVLMKDFPYQNLIRTLMYIILSMHPDIAFAVSTLSKYSANPGHTHWDQAMHIHLYLTGTKTHHLTYDGNSSGDLTLLIIEYTGSNWAGNSNTQ